jgi:lysophospholipase L1-like esterase
MRGVRPTVTTLLLFMGIGVVAFFAVDRNLRGVQRLFYRPARAATAGDEPAAPAPPAMPGAAPVAAAAPDEEPPLPPRPSIVDAGKFSGRPIDDPTGALVPFYRALAAKKGPVRVLWFGDSIIADDNLSSRVRHALQQTFGDGGPGFVYGGEPSRWNELRDATHETSSGFTTYSIVYRPMADKLYGLGGATFEATAAGKTASYGTVKDGKVSRFELAYLAQPGGGKLDVSVDGTLAKTIDTAADAPVARWETFAAPDDGGHTMTVKTDDAGKVRLFGVELGRDQPGAVVVDNLGLASNSAEALNQIDPPHWKEQIQHATPALILVFLGANEADVPGWASKKASAAYERDFEKLLGTIRDDAPDAGCLVLAPLDSSVKQGGDLVTKPALPYLVAAQEQAAKANGCAFWNSFAWMGGKGSMTSWYPRLVSPDYMHPTRAGAAKIGDALYAALIHGYDEWATKQ